MYELVVDGQQFADSMRLLARTSSRSAASELMLSFRNGDLTAELAGACVSVPATGTWPGTVSVGRGVLSALAKTSKITRTLRVTDDERLELEGFSFSCRCSPLALASIDLPLDPTLVQILRLRQEYSSKELIALGLLERVEDAERQMDSLIRSAAGTLADLGDFSARIAELVQREVYGES